MWTSAFKDLSENSPREEWVSSFTLLNVSYIPIMQMPFPAEHWMSLWQKNENSVHLNMLCKKFNAKNFSPTLSMNLDSKEPSSRNFPVETFQ